MPFAFHRVSTQSVRKVRTQDDAISKVGGGWRSCVGGEWELISGFEILPSAALIVLSLAIHMDADGGVLVRLPVCCYDILVAPKELCALAKMICIFSGCMMVLCDCGLHQLTYIFPFF